MVWVLNMPVKPVLLLLLIAFVAIRAHWRKVWVPVERQQHHDRRERILTASFSLTMALVSLCFLCSNLLDFAALDLALPAQVAGLCIAISGLLLLASVQRDAMCLVIFCDGREREGESSSALSLFLSLSL